MKNKKKKGFTLIELLAVLVVLAIIITIAVLSVSSLIKDAKEESKKIMINDYVDKVEDAMKKQQVTTNEKLEDGLYYLNEGTPTFPYTVESEFIPKGKVDYVIIKNSKVVNYKLTTDEVVITKDEEYTKEEVKDWINVRDYGAKGDGITDDTASIRKAITYLNEHGGTLHFPQGTYIVSISKKDESALLIKSDKKIIIDFASSTIKMNPNPITNYNIIKIENSKDVTIKNGSLVGDRINHIYDTQTHDKGYGIYNYYSEKVLIKNMNISQMTGDAIINKTGTESGENNYVLIEDCELSYSRRQGISILDTDIIEVKNVYIHDIGTSNGINGSSPMCGIDIEPASGTKKVGSLLLDNVTIKNNTRYGIVNGNLTDKFIIKNSYIDNVTMQKATIYNSTINWNDNFRYTDNNKIDGFAISNLNIYNSTLNHNANGRDVFISGGKVENSRINVSKENSKTRFYIQPSVELNNMVCDGYCYYKK